MFMDPRVMLVLDSCCLGFVIQMYERRFGAARMRNQDLDYVDIAQLIVTTILILLLLVVFLGGVVQLAAGALLGVGIAVTKMQLLLLAGGLYSLKVYARFRRFYRVYFPAAIH